MRALPAIIAFAAGIIVAAVTCSVLNSVRESGRQIRLLSDLHYPMRQCLDDIVETYERGNVSLAHQKTRLLRQRWSEYLNGGGRSPELFASEVMELTAAATRPARPASAD
jgi:hypothetical protein